MKHNKKLSDNPYMAPAAFGRLCVETMPPAGQVSAAAQPPSGGCVLKRQHRQNISDRLGQPPSGGCVLKQLRLTENILVRLPAAFGRLCVETHYFPAPFRAEPPAAFGRLCVETAIRITGRFVQFQPPSGGCVLKQMAIPSKYCPATSRLRAAVC